MDIRPLLFLLPLGFALAACTNHEPVADGDDGYDRATVPTDATGDSDQDVAGLTGGAATPGTGEPRATGVTGEGPAVAGGLNAAEAETVAIEATGQDANDSAAADVAGAEGATRDDNSNQYERAPVASDAVEAGYNDDDRDGGD
ncbi:hypothetical protein [Luteimonas sp. MC1895]|uniref:hypothetical protein n=1 Tax=Luteimonas sp. MC1895 TaxID=2819513 RepID=UPI0018F0BC3B|nr:hypothetical protein [Luteimonas sp. MC1895]MBJ6979463.1 hypothetical protein [Luteimonas sp. MC1895]